MSRVVLRNETDYPDVEVRALVREGFSGLELDPRLGSVVVRVRYTRLSDSRREDSEYAYGASGRAHPYVFVRPDIPKGAAWEIHLRIGRPEEFPVKWYDRRGVSASIGLLADWREALVAIAAHEGKHIEMYQRLGRKTSRRAIGLSAVREEDRCDSYAAKQIRRFREEAP